VTDRPRRPVTIATIAAEAGVSVPTVSRVLNGRSDVAPQTRARIEQLLRAHGYRKPRRRAWASPPLTTVHQPLTQMGRRAVRMALRLIDGESMESPRVELATELVVRESAVAL
jgi:DNA-binding LacI/PurR family transcriptional regulator